MANQLNPKKVLVTGGAGFIGSALVRYLINDLGLSVLNIDKLTYAGNLESLKSVEQNGGYTFLQADICNQAAMQNAFAEFKPDVVMHLAAESHVDRSIDGAAEFIQTNVVGTFTLLEVARKYWDSLDQAAKECFRFHHISTDEVYGDLEGTSDLFTEDTSYEPSSPYSASKAGSDHLVRAWYRTYGLPVVITNCSNNYGPYQFPEKLIPLMILNALDGKSLPVYGEGKQIRDWLYVDDHVEALWQVVTKGALGETYNIGGHNEKQNIEVVHAICDLLEELVPIGNPVIPAPKSVIPANEPESARHPELDKVNCEAREGGLGHSGPMSNLESNKKSYRDLITHVQDRPGHDLRYAIDASKIECELGWKPKQTFEIGLRQTVEWYLSNNEWVKHVQDRSYQRERLGVTLGSETSQFEKQGTQA